MSNGTAIDYRDASQIRSAGIEALTKALGPVGMAYFMRQFEKGSGNYTEERHTWLDRLSMDEVLEGVRKIEKIRQQNGPAS
ncbi:MAG: hypothetical protein LBD82_01245 [Deltaproteobacteria bacterium]|jgi:hypothetical protein|nr:hypothetical protein [Deltaproteobacteria bacterium]